MLKSIRILILAIFLPVVLLNINCSPAESQESEDKSVAPDFTLTDLNGQEVTLSQFREDKNVLLVFGATWCPYCVDEIPELKEVYEKYQDDDIEVIYVDVQESLKKVSSFAQKHSLPYTVLLDETGSVAGQYNVRGIPHNVLIDKEGLIVYQGPRPFDGFIPLIENLIGE